jgi:hypothetical protein
LYPAGTDVLLMAQPYRAYAKTLLERQAYPARKLGPNGPPERPYDVAGWTLPDQMGVHVQRIERPFQLPPMNRLQRASIPPSRIHQSWTLKRPSYYVIDAVGNGGAIAMNRLFATGLRPAWLPTAREFQIPTSGEDVLRFRFEPGAVVIPYSKERQSVVENIATELGLKVVALAGKIPADGVPLERARVALYKPWMENIDEGWTRWLLKQYEFPFENIADAELRAGNLRSRYDVIIVPDAPPDRLITGHPKGTVPPEYTGGLGEEGVAALKAFVEAGGTLVCLDAAGGLAIDAFHLPIRNVAHDAGPERFFCPGSILRLQLDPSKPLAFGMEPETAAFFAYSDAYEIAAPSSVTDGHGGGAEGNPIETIARYAAKNLLLSGWLEGEPVIAGRAAVLEADVDRGRVILIGFRAQHRGQSHATFRLLFNSIFTAK